jgi:hypothetical protein
VLGVSSTLAFARAWPWIVIQCSLDILIKKVVKGACPRMLPPLRGREGITFITSTERPEHHWIEDFYRAPKRTSHEITKKEIFLDPNEF